MAHTSMSASTPRAIAFNSDRRRWPLRCFFTVLLLALSLEAGAESGAIELLLAQSEAPYGVVFEIVECDAGALRALLPKVRDAIARFASTHFAVVSHGREELALQSRKRSEFEQIHKQVQSLLANDVPLHVCETHASWYEVTASDFPDYVDLVPTGPGQIKAYLDLGYTLIVVD